MGRGIPIRATCEQAPAEISDEASGDVLAHLVQIDSSDNGDGLVALELQEEPLLGDFPQRAAAFLQGLSIPPNPRQRLYLPVVHAILENFVGGQLHCCFDVGGEHACYSHSTVAGGLLEMS